MHLIFQTSSEKPVLIRPSRTEWTPPSEGQMSQLRTYYGAKARIALYGHGTAQLIKHRVLSSAPPLNRLTDPRWEIIGIVDLATGLYTPRGQ